MAGVRGSCPQEGHLLAKLPFRVKVMRDVGRQSRFREMSRSCILSAGLIAGNHCGFRS